MKKLLPILCILALNASVSAKQVEISGVITSKTDTEITIEINHDWAPAPGDPVTITWALGSRTLDGGTAEVIEADAQTVIAKILSGKPNVKMEVVILSEKPPPEPTEPEPVIEQPVEPDGTEPEQVVEKVEAPHVPSHLKLPPGRAGRYRFDFSEMSYSIEVPDGVRIQQKEDGSMKNLRIYLGGRRGANIYLSVWPKIHYGKVTKKILKQHLREDTRYGIDRNFRKGAENEKIKVRGGLGYYTQFENMTSFDPFEDYWIYKYKTKFRIIVNQRWVFRGDILSDDPEKDYFEQCIEILESIRILK
jgi:hypothetical protein